MKESYEINLSESISGEGIALSSSQEGSLVHQTLINTQYSDRLNIYASSLSENVVIVTILWGSDVLIFNVGVNENIRLLIPGFIIKGGLAVKAFASEDNVIKLFGSVARIREIE